MSKSLTRIVAFLLVPCLAMDPVAASAVSNNSFSPRRAQPTLFTEQALSANPLSTRHPYLLVPFFTGLFVIAVPELKLSPATILGLSYALTGTAGILAVLAPAPLPKGPVPKHMLSTWDVSAKLSKKRPLAPLIDWAVQQKILIPTFKKNPKKGILDNFFDPKKLSKITDLFFPREDTVNTAELAKLQGRSKADVLKDIASKTLKPDQVVITAPGSLDHRFSHEWLVKEGFIQKAPTPIGAEIFGVAETDVDRDMNPFLPEEFRTQLVDKENQVILQSMPEQGICRLLHSAQYNSRKHGKEARFYRVDKKSRLRLGRVGQNYGYRAGTKLRLVGVGDYVEIWPSAQQEKIERDAISKLGGIPQLFRTPSTEPQNVMAGTYPGHLSSTYGLQVPLSIADYLQDRRVVLYLAGPNLIRVFGVSDLHQLIEKNAPEKSAELSRAYRHVVFGRIYPKQIFVFRNEFHLTIPLSLQRRMGLHAGAPYQLVGQGSYFEIRLGAQQESATTKFIPIPSFVPTVMRSMTDAGRLSLAALGKPGETISDILIDVIPRQGVRVIMDPERWLGRLRKDVAKDRSRIAVLADAFWAKMDARSRIEIDERSRAHSRLRWGKQAAVSKIGADFLIRPAKRSDYWKRVEDSPIFNHPRRHHPGLGDSPEDVPAKSTSPKGMWRGELRFDPDMPIQKSILTPPERRKSILIDAACAEVHNRLDLVLGETIDLNRQRMEQTTKAFFEGTITLSQALGAVPRTDRPLLAALLISWELAWRHRFQEHLFTSEFVANYLFDYLLKPDQDPNRYFEKLINQGFFEIQFFLSPKENVALLRRALYEFEPSRQLSVGHLRLVPEASPEEKSSAVMLAEAFEEAGLLYDQERFEEALGLLPETDSDTETGDVRDVIRIRADAQQGRFDDARQRLVPALAYWFNRMAPERNLLTDSLQNEPGDALSNLLSLIANHQEHLRVHSKESFDAISRTGQWSDGYVAASYLGEFLIAAADLLARESNLVEASHVLDLARLLGLPQVESHIEPVERRILEKRESKRVGDEKASPVAPKLTQAAGEISDEPYSSRRDDLEIAHELSMQYLFSKYLRFGVPFSLTYSLLRVFGQGFFQALSTMERWRWIEVPFVSGLIAAASLGTSTWSHWVPLGVWTLWLALLWTLKRKDGITNVKVLTREIIAITFFVGAYGLIYFRGKPFQLLAQIQSWKTLGAAVFAFSALAAFHWVHKWLVDFSFALPSINLSHKTFRDALHFLKDYSGEENPELYETAGQILRIYTASSKERPIEPEEQRMLLEIFDAGKLDAIELQLLVESLALSLHHHPASLPEVVSFVIQHPSDADWWAYLLGFYLQLPGGRFDSDSVRRLMDTPKLLNNQVFIDRVIDPLYFKQAETMKPFLSRLAELSKARSTAAMLGGVSTSTLDESVRRIQADLRSGPKKVLIVHNIKDGFGDELIRNVAVMEGLLMGNPQLEITIFSGRSKMYHHPRVRAFDIRTQAIDTSQDYDLVIDHHDPAQTYDERVETAVNAVIANGSPEQRSRRFFVNYTVGLKNLYFGAVSPKGETLPLVRRWNVYAATYQLCAALGIRFPYGEETRTESVLLGEGSDDTYWKDVINTQNQENRPVIIFNGFGGTYKDKGYKFILSYVEILEILAKQGYFVLLLTNHQPWGSQARAKEIVQTVSEPLRKYIHIPPHDPDLSGSYINLVHLADFILTVEGGLVHLAYALGKSFGVLFKPESGELIWWMPQGASQNQYALRVDWGSPLTPYLPPVSPSAASSSSPGSIKLARAA